MSSSPIDDFIEARDLFKAGDKDKAAEMVANSLGAEKATTPIKGSLEVIFDRRTILHGAVIDAVAVEAKKRKKDV